MNLPNLFLNSVYCCQCFCDVISKKYLDCCELDKRDLKMHYFIFLIQFLANQLQICIVQICLNFAKIEKFPFFEHPFYNHRSLQTENFCFDITCACASLNFVILILSARGQFCLENWLLFHENEIKRFTLASLQK